MLGQEGLSAAATGNGPGDDKDRTDPDTWLVFDTSVTDLTPTARLWVKRVLCFADCIFPVPKWCLPVTVRSLLCLEASQSALISADYGFKTLLGNVILFQSLPSFWES